MIDGSIDDLGVEVNVQCKVGVGDAGFGRVGEG